MRNPPVKRPDTILLIADDVFRIGLKTVLESEGYPILVDSRSLEHASDVNLAELVVTDCNEGEQSAPDLVRGIRENWPGCKIAVLASKVEAMSFLSLILEGVSGYFRRDLPLPTLLASLSTLYELDLLIVGPLALDELRKEFPHIKRLMPASALKNVSQEELAIMELLQEGHTVDQMASSLHASKRTIERRTKGLYEKLDTKGQFAAGVRAAKFGLI